jgi:hypothetical protein
MTDASPPTPDRPGGAPADVVAGTAGRVRDMLAPFGDVVVGDDGTCSLAYGSARVVVDVGVFDEDQAVVHVRSRCVTGATPSPELYHWVATNRADLGQFTVVDEDDGSATIEFSRALIGEFLNPAELRLTVVAVAFTSDHFDDDLAARFGGEVHDAGANIVEQPTS